MGSPLPPTPPMSGTNRLQSSIDRLAQAMDRIIPAVRTASDTGSGVWSGGRLSLAPGGNPGWAGTPNGGWTSSNYRARWTRANYLAASRGNGGHPASGYPSSSSGGPSSGYPSSGSGTPAPGAGGGPAGASANGMSMMIPGLKSGWEASVNYGNQQMSGQTAMDTYYHYSQQLNGGTPGLNRNRYLNGVFGSVGSTTNNIGLNRTDILAGDILRQRTSGGYGSYNYQLAGRNIAAVNMATGGTLGALQSTQIQNSLYSPQMYWRLRQMGMGSNLERGGKRVGVSRIAENILQRVYPGQNVDLKELNASLQSGGGLAYTLDQMGLDPGTRTAMEDIIRQRVTARNGGLGPEEFDRLTEQATGPDQSKPARARARARLKDAGVDVNTMLDAQKTIQGGTDQRDAMINGDFAASMKQAAGAVDAFNVAISKFLKDTGLSSALSASGGTSTLNGFMSTMGKVFGASLNPASWLSGGGVSMLTSAFSQGPETPSNANSSSSTPGTSGGKETVGKGPNMASRVLALMQSQAGDPYVWGGNGPNGWDCSGIIKWALDTAGFKVPGGVPRVAGDQINKIPGEWISPSEVRPGDLLYRSPGHGGPGEHIAMYAGGGKTIEARSKAYGVGNFPATKGRAFNKAKRIFSGAGTVKSITNDYEPEAGTENTLNKQKGTGSWAGAGNTGDSYGSSEEASLIAAALGGQPGAGPTKPTNFAGTLGETPTSNPGDLSGEKGTTPESAKKIAKSLLKQFGWGMGEWDELEKLWTKESGWNYKAKNKSSGAYGIPQSLPGSKMAKFGSDWRDNPVTQIKWGLDYIKQRYKTPSAAWAKSQKVGWYDKGAWEIQQDEFARIHQGEMVLPKKQADTIRDALLKDTFYGSSPGTSRGDGGRAVSLTFNSGSVVIQVSGSLNDSTARSAARAFADELAKEEIYTRLASGVTHA